MKIQPLCNSSITYKSSQSNNQQSNIRNCESSKRPLALDCMAIIGRTLVVQPSFKSEQIRETFKPNPKDDEYRSDILKHINVPNVTQKSLNSIMGGEEYKKTLIDFSDSSIHYTPGDSIITKERDGYDLTGVENKTFRISLHNHTTHSDGRMTVQDILDQSATYADKVAKHIKKEPATKSPQNPFTIAITDHDSVEGCKEALNIITKNPDKYKNLRVILGCELTVENRMLKDEQHKPIPLHMVVNCINPYDKELNKYLDRKKEARKGVTEAYFSDCINEIGKKNKKLAKKLDLNEVRATYPTIRKGLNYPWYYTRDYITQKADENNRNKIKGIIYKAREKYEPKMNLQPYCMDMEETMNIIKKQKYGYMTIAHPALIDIGECINDKETAYQSMAKIFKNFKEKGESRALATELSYPYWGNLGASKAWLDNINNSAKEAGLIPSGGLDTHGSTIFYSGKV